MSDLVRAISVCDPGDWTPWFTLRSLRSVALRIFSDSCCGVNSLLHVNLPRVFARDAVPHHMLICLVGGSHCNNILFVYIPSVQFDASMGEADLEKLDFNSIEDVRMRVRSFFITNWCVNPTRATDVTSTLVMFSIGNSLTLLRHIFDKQGAYIYRGLFHVNTEPISLGYNLTGNLFSVDNIPPYIKLHDDNEDVPYLAQVGGFDREANFCSHCGSSLRDSPLHKGRIVENVRVIQSPSPSPSRNRNFTEDFIKKLMDAGYGTTIKNTRKRVNMALSAYEDAGPIDDDPVGEDRYDLNNIIDGVTYGTRRTLTPRSSNDSLYRREVCRLTSASPGGIGSATSRNNVKQSGSADKEKNYADFDDDNKVYEAQMDDEEENVGSFSSFFSNWTFKHKVSLDNELKEKMMEFGDKITRDLNKTRDLMEGAWDKIQFFFKNVVLPIVLWTTITYLIIKVKNLIKGNIAGDIVTIKRAFKIVLQVGAVLSLLTMAFYAFADPSTIQLALKDVNVTVTSINILLKDMLKNHSKPEEVVYEAQLSCVDEVEGSLSKLLIVMLTICSVGKAPEGKKLDKFLATSSLLSRSHEGIHKGIGFVIQLMQEAINFVRTEFLGMGPIYAFEGLFPEVRDWCLKVESIVNEARKPSWRIDLYNYNRVMELEKQGNRFFLVKSNVSENAAVKAAVTRYLSLIRKLVVQFEQANIGGNSPRMEPVTVFLTGSTGCGKSTVTMPLIYAVLSKVLEDNEKMQFQKSPEDYVYSRTAEQKFWDGYQGQIATIFDDFLQARDSDSDPDGELMNIVRATNVFPYALHMASLENKGKTTFSSKFILCTSNLSGLQNARSVVCPAAVGRRFTHSYKVVPSVEFSKEGTTNGSLDDRVIDRFKVGPTGNNPLELKIYEFHELEWNGSDTRLTGRKFNFYQVANQLIESYCARDKKGQIYNGKLRTFVDAWCDDNQKFFQAQSGNCGSSEDSPALDMEMPEGFEDDPFLDSASDTSTVRPISTKRLLDKIKKGKNRTAVWGDGSLDKWWDHCIWFGRSTVAWKIFTDAMDSFIALVHNHDKYFWNDFDLLYKSREQKYSVVIFSLSRLLPDLVRDIELAIKNEDLEDVNAYCAILPALVTEVELEEFRNELYSEIRSNISQNWYAEVKDAFEDFEKAENTFGQKVKRYLRSDKGAIVKGLAILGVVVGVSYGIYKMVKMFNDKDSDEDEDLDVKASDQRRADFNEIYYAPPYRYKVHKAESFYVRKEDVLTPDEEESLEAEMASGSKGRGKKSNRSKFRTLVHRHDENVVYQGQSSSGDTLFKFYPERKFWIAQGGADENSLLLARSLLQRNVYRIHDLGPNDKSIGSIFFLCGTIAVMPLHYYKVVKLWLKAGKLSEDKNVRFVNGLNKHVFTVSIKEFLSGTYTKEMEAKDLYAVRFDRSIKPHSDIRRKFISKATWSKPFDKLVNLCILENDHSWRIECGPAYVFDREIPVSKTVNGERNAVYYTVKDVVKYHFSTMPGDCGSFILLNNSAVTPAKIVGVHLAGFNNSEGAGTIITREFADEIASLFADKPIINEPDEVMMEAQSSSISYDNPFQIPVATTDKVAPCGGISKIIRSPLYGTWGPSKTRPAFLRPLDPGGIDPRHVGLSGYCSNKTRVDVDLLRAISEDYASYLFNINENSHFRRDRCVFTFDEAIVGIVGLDYCDGIPRDTSPGYPYILQKPQNSPGKTWWFGSEGDYELNNPQVSELRDRVVHIIDKAKDNVRLLHLFTDFPKDERRPIEKALAMKTRMISGCALDYTIVFRMYFLDFCIFLMRHRGSTGSCVGINPRSEEWHTLAKDLSRFKSVVAGDFSQFDKKQQIEFLWAILDLINRWYDDSDVNKNIREILWYEVVFSFHIFGGEIIQWISSLSSGHPATTIINTILHVMLMMYVFVITSRLGLHGIQFFREKVCARVYGDDGVYSISDDAIHFFNQHTITEVMLKIGYIYTDEGKLVGNKAPLCRDLEEVSFLKRSFRYDKELGKWLAPLSLETILEMPYWTKDTKESMIIVKDNVDVALMELGLHDKVVYDQWASKIIDAAKKKIGFSPQFSSYESNRMVALSSKEIW